MSTTVTELDKVKTGRWNGGRSPFNVEYGKIMMWFFLTSDAFTFSAFLIYYGTQRFAHLTWPDPDKVFQSIPFIADHGYPLVFVGIMTFILIMSSVTMVLAVEAGHRNSKKEVVNWMIATIIGGLMFIGCQALEWTHLHHQGFWWGSIPFQEGVSPEVTLEPYFSREISEVSALQFANLFFTITGFHGFHVSVGILLNIIVLGMVLANTFERRGSYLMVEKVGLYWHFVDLVWVFVFTFFYLV
ncbi:cytochrome c oxidase subunit 3 [Parapedobacter sp. ISTM3]|uniref:Cytochrome c oxidase subunit 3 n=1 Tax=Parapedobacter luteus TaxID=623280 RepID=A0A1T5DRW1_9SPHI|nr:MULTISPECIES: cytochrome c oxidase subunit 3 [Parapedobacter]MBK1440856.1 cytochrome c oxidase subunit 3 [Parapedobacter sp. ISTM3]SKB74401.1 cytochrome c oxidase subunit 3 [Parapedobacter luteus]